MDLQGFDDDLVGDAPCEFCGELYPLILLIEHQTTHLEELDEQVLYAEEPPVKKEADVSAKVQQDVSKKASVMSTPDKPIKTQREEKTESEVKIPEKSTEEKQTGHFDIKNELLEIKKLQSQKKIDLTKVDIKNVLVYDAELSVEKNTENENDLKSEEKDVADINDLSDDDCAETMEEFWKRARDHLKQGKVKLRAES